MKANISTPKMNTYSSTQKIKILLVEDEPIIGEDLKRTLTKMDYEVMEVLCSGEETLEYIKKDIPDLVLLDIQLDGYLDGIDTAHEISKIHPIPIIYLTSNTDERTFSRAKLTQPFAFLSKPYRIRDITHAIDLAFSDESESIIPHNQEKETKTQRIKDHIFVKSQGHLVKIRLDDIIYVEADSCYCEIMTSNGRHVIVSTLKKFAEAIGSQDIMRVHRSFMINLKAIEKVGDGLIYTEQKEIPIGRSYREELYGMLPKL